MVQGSTVKPLTNLVFGVWFSVFGIYPNYQLPITHYPIPSPQSPLPNSSPLPHP
ncbi:hypothetical protein HCG51_15905 [Tolypothrix sp. PCC 7910]|nr:hypothetical protein HCG51_15905 [Tolypothrix sp. PCC 7910]